MFNLKTFNNIAEDGLNILRKNKFQEVSENEIVTFVVSNYVK